MSNFLILGDVHLGKSSPTNKSFANSFITAKLSDQIRLLNFVHDMAVEKYCENIIITGDIFEEPRADTECLNIFSDWIKSCEHENINVHIIMGNHDYLRIGSTISTQLDIFSNFNNVSVYKNIDTIYINNTAITLIPFMDRRYLNCETISEAKEELRSLINHELLLIPDSYKKICIGHIALEGAIYIGDEVQDITNEIIAPINYFDDFDNTWMGHVHKYQKLKNNVFHIGSMDVSNFGECLESKHFIIYDSLNNQYEEKELPIVKLQKISLNVESNEDLESKLSELEFDNTLIYKLEVTYNNEDSLGKAGIKKILSKNNVNNVFTIQENKKNKIQEKKNNKLSFNLDVLENIKKYAEGISFKDKEYFISRAIELLSEVK